jgi:MinD-like ATPase involved in chromosome partitioning or flagellar assembly
MTDSRTTFPAWDEGEDELRSALALLFPGDTAAACVRADRLTPGEVRRAYDSRIKDLHPNWNETPAEDEIRAREQRFHDLTAAYCLVLASLRESRRDAGPETTAPRSTAGDDVADAPVLIAVAGAEEAVGATTIAGTIAAALAAAGHETLAVDLDPSGRPLAEWLSASGRPGPLDRLLEDPEFGVFAAETGTAVPRLTLLGGGTAAADAGLRGAASRRHLVRTLRACGRRFVVLDLGRASDRVRLDLLTAADVRFLVTTAQPGALRAAFALLDTMVRRLLARYREACLARGSDEALAFDEVLGRARWEDSADRPPRDLYARLARSHPATGREVAALVRSHAVHVVANHQGTRPTEAALLGLVVRSKTDLDLPITDVHPVPDDKRIYAALRYGGPSLAAVTDGRAARAVCRCAARIFFPAIENADTVILRRLRASVPRADLLAAVGTSPIATSPTIAAR